MMKNPDNMPHNQYDEKSSKNNNRVICNRNRVNLDVQQQAI